jgi:serine/threonine protein kinase
MSEEQREFVDWALQRNPADRPTVAELLQHPWITLHQVRPRVQIRIVAGSLGRPLLEPSRRSQVTMRAQQSQHQH